MQMMLVVVHQHQQKRKEDLVDLVLHQSIYYHLNFVRFKINELFLLLLVVVGGGEDAPAPSSTNNLDGDTSIIEIDQEPRTVVRARTNPGSLPVGANAFMNTLSIVDYVPSDENELCAICQIGYPAEDAMVHFLPCLHKFHVKCIRTCIRKPTNTCPVCKTQLFNIM